MKIRVHTKLIALFLTGSFLLVMAAITVSSLNQRQYNEQFLARVQVQIAAGAEQFQKQLDSMEESVLRLSIANETNQFSLYTWDSNKSAIYEKSKTLYQQLQTMKFNYKALEGVWLIFTKQGRQITDRLRYDAIDSELHEMLLTGTDGFLIQNSDLYFVSALSTSSIYGPGSLAAAQISLQELLDEFCTAVGSVEAQLTVAGETIVGSIPESLSEGIETEVWEKGKNGWILVQPLLIGMKGYQDMYLEVFLPQTSLEIVQNNYLIWTLVLILIGIIEFLVFSMMLRRIVMRPLDTLLGAFNDVANGKLDVEIHYDRRDDFFDIYDQFNRNTKRLNELIDKEYKSKAEARNAELKYLQTQINPHFLYNAFYQMYRICRSEGGEMSSEFALLLSGYYEYITHDSNNEGIVCLADEIKQAERYLQIQQFRFGERIQFVFEVEEICQQAQVPKFILQPILENAIKYGFEEKRQGRTELLIKVTGSCKEGKTVLLIEDNGLSLKEEHIVKMQQNLCTGDSVYGKNSLTNIWLRLQQLFSECEMVFGRSELGGLAVKMEIGKRKE